MLEVIRTQTQAMPLIPISQPACEVSRFMKNFFEAAQSGNAEELATYFSDEMQVLDFPLNAAWSDETLSVDDHLATFSCTLTTEENPQFKMTCVLDKSEGYWQIIHGEVQDNSFGH